MTVELENLLERIAIGKVPKEGWNGFVHCTPEGDVDYVIFEDKAITDKEFIEAYYELRNVLVG